MNPVYDGSEESIRAICQHLLSSPVAHASFAFPASLKKEERHQVHLIVDEVGWSKLRHESTGRGRSRALTVSRIKAAAVDAQPTEVDPLPAFIRGLPQSAYGTRLPAVWRKTAGEMCEAVCGEISAANLHDDQLLGRDAAKVWEATTRVLLLFALYRQQRASDVAHRTDYTDRFIDAAMQLCHFAAQHIESKCSEAPVDGRLLRTMEDKLIEPLCALVELIRPPALAGVDNSQQLLLSALLPLAQRLVHWLHAQQAALPHPAATNWAHPVSPSPLFPSAHAPSHYAFSEHHNSCKCVLCQQLLGFLRNSRQQTTEFRMRDKERKHVEARVAALHNPHLHCDTIPGRPSYTLRVTKRKTIAECWDERRAVLQSLINRLDVTTAAISSAVASCNSSACSPTSTSPPAASPLQPTTAQSEKKRSGRPAKAGKKRKRELIELGDEEEGQQQADKENSPSRDD